MANDVELLMSSAVISKYSGGLATHAHALNAIPLAYRRRPRDQGHQQGHAVSGAGGDRGHRGLPRRQPRRQPRGLPQPRRAETGRHVPERGQGHPAPALPCSTHLQVNNMAAVYRKLARIPTACFVDMRLHADDAADTRGCIRTLVRTRCVVVELTAVFCLQRLCGAAGPVLRVARRQLQELGQRLPEHQQRQAQAVS